jgi:hypothetical protein
MRIAQKGKPVTQFMPLIERFPDHELAIRRLCNLDSEFRGACEDYCEAAEAVVRWSKTELMDRAEEFRVILKELEADILDVLNADQLRVAKRDG